MKKQTLMERLRAKRGVRSTVFGVGWYTQEAWGRVKATATDPERFESTYAQWAAMAGEAVVDFKKAGVNPVKVYLVPEELLPWLLLHKKPNSAASRAEFVSEKVRAQNEAGKDAGS